MADSFSAAASGPQPFKKYFLTKEVGNEAAACVLQMRTTTEYSYLAGAGPEGMGPLQHVALFHSHDTSRGRGVYAIAMPMEHRSALPPLHTLLPIATVMANRQLFAQRLKRMSLNVSIFSQVMRLAWTELLPALPCPASPCPVLLCRDLSAPRVGRQTLPWLRPLHTR